MKSKITFSISCLAILSACSSTPKVTDDQMKGIFAENKSSTDECYNKSKEKTSGQSGTVALKFLINEEGKAYKTVYLKKSSTIYNKGLNVCLKRAVQSWQFPNKNPLELVYPFEFGKLKPEEQAQAPSEATPQEAPLIDVQQTTTDEGEATPE